MKNDYDIKSDHVVIYLDRRDGSTLETLISLEDFHIADSIPGKWHATKKKVDGIFYVYANAPKNKEGIRGNPIILHRLLMQDQKLTQQDIVDHINHNTLDNRRVNLRIVDKSANMQNRAGNQTNNKSGYRGVHWDRSREKWLVSVKINGKTKYIGRYDGIEEAKKAAVEARAKYLPFSSDARRVAGND